MKKYLSLAVVATGLATSLITSPTSIETKQSGEKQFALFFYESPSGFKDRNNANAGQYWEKWGGYIGGLQQSGKMSAGSALITPEVGTNITKAGESKIDAKVNQLSGYVVINAKSLQEAIALGKKCPGIADGGSVQVREILPMDQHKESN